MTQLRPAFTLTMLSATLIACDTAPRAQHPAVVAVIIDTTRKFQVISGWEAVDQAGQEIYAGYPLYRDSLISLAVNDLGITRIRLGLRSGHEQRVDNWTEYRLGRRKEFRCTRFWTDNDNNDPFVINEAGFHFAYVDFTIDQLIEPLQRALQARGEQLHINANYASFMRVCPPGTKYHHNTADEYAENVLAVHLHLRRKYGWVPDTWEIILEPENTDVWSGTAIGNAVVASAGRLEQNGFRARFIAPSTMRAANTLRYFIELNQVPGALHYIDEIAYHRYGRIRLEDVRAVGELGQRFDKRTSMLEHIGSGYSSLHEDLKHGQVSAWTQFALAYDAKEDDGAQYYLLRNPNSRHPRIELAKNTRYLRQYFRYVRPGARRVEARSGGAAVDVVAFLGPADRAVAVAKASAAARVVVTGLPVGTYQARYTTADETDVSARVEQAAGQLAATIPAPGVLTIYRKSARARGDLGAVH